MYGRHILIGWTALFFTKVLQENWEVCQHGSLVTLNVSFHPAVSFRELTYFTFTILFWTVTWKSLLSHSWRSCSNATQEKLISPSKIIPTLLPLTFICRVFPSIVSCSLTFLLMPHQGEMIFALHRDVPFFGKMFWFSGEINQGRIEQAVWHWSTAWRMTVFHSICWVFFHGRERPSKLQ